MGKARCLAEALSTLPEACSAPRQLTLHIVEDAGGGAQHAVRHVGCRGEGRGLGVGSQAAVAAAPGLAHRRKRRRRPTWSGSSSADYTQPPRGPACVGENGG